MYTSKSRTRLQYEFKDVSSLMRGSSSAQIEQNKNLQRILPQSSSASNSGLMDGESRKKTSEETRLDTSFRILSFCGV